MTSSGQKILLILLCIIPVYITAQRPFKELTINNGLPHTDAHYTVQDAKGFLWFATLDGLCRYDGADMVIYRNIHSDLNSISNNRINCIQYDDSRKGLWVGTQGGGLNFLNMETGKFIRLSIKNNQGEKLREVTSLKELQNGAIWVGTVQGVYYTNPGLDVTSDIEFKPVASQAKYFIQSIYEHDDHSIWMGTQNGLVHLDAKRKNIHLVYPAVFKTVNAITRFDKNHVLFGTPEGLYKLNTFNYKFEKVFALNVSSVVKDRNEKIWVGTFNDGLYQLDTTGRQQQHFSIGNNSNFRSDNIKNIFIDRFESIFICTTGSGIRILNQNNHIFTSYPLNLPPKEFSKIRKPLTFYPINKKYIWIGTKGNGLALYNRQAESYTFFNINAYASHITPSQDVLAINETKDHDLLIGTAAGLFLLNHNKVEGAMRSGELPAMQNLLDTYGAVRVNKIVRDSVQRIWLATSVGLLYFDENMQLLGKVTAAGGGPLSLSNDFVNDMLFTTDADKQKLTVWLATRGGINKLTFDNSSLTLTKLVKILAGNGPADLFSNWISLLHRDKRGNIWAGTIGGGLSRMINNKDDVFTFETITTDDGLLTNDIETLLEDEEGNFWIGSIGLTKFNPLKKSFRFYNASDGLQSNAFKVWSAYKYEDGEMIFGGINGFNIFYPAQIKKNTAVLSPQLTNLFINNIPVKVGAEVEGDVILTKTLSYSSSIRLNHKIKNFGIEFASVHSYDFSKIIYRYRLKGHDDNWIYANSKKRFANYSGLPPGKYRFELEASGGGGVWNASPTVLNIEILPSFWQSKAGYAFYILTALVVLFLLRRYTLIRLDTKHKLELEKARQEQDIKSYEEKIQFFTTISHELRTPLTLIITPIEQMMDQGGFSPSINHRLDVALKNAQRLKGLIDQILDVRKLELGKFVLHTEDVSIGKIVSGIFIQFEDLAAQKNIEYSFKVLSNAKVRIDCGKMEQVLINLLANAMRFTSDKGKIMLEVSQAEKDVIIKITNTGSYLTPQQQSKIFEPFYQVNDNDNVNGTGLGLTISKYLIELHQGKIVVQSTDAADIKDAKTSFIIHLPVIDILLPEEKIALDDVPKPPNDKEPKNAEPVITSPTLPSVIIIDDNEELRSILIDEFKKDYHVLEATDGKQGLKMIHKYKPCLVITDIMMPGIDGLDLCKTLKTDVATSDIPVIILTAKVTDQNKIAGLEALADDYLCKPFNLKELKIKAKNIIQQREKLRTKIKNNMAMEPVKLSFDSRDEHIIKEVISIIESNIDNPDLKVEFLCSEAAMSRPALYRKIKELTGMSIQTFILDIRLKRAAQLLSNRAFSVSEIVYKTGFSSPSYFNKAFKKKYSVNPAHYADSLQPEAAESTF